MEGNKINGKPDERDRRKIHKPFFLTNVRSTSKAEIQISQKWGPESIRVHTSMAKNAVPDAILSYAAAWKFITYKRTGNKSRFGRLEKEPWEVRGTVPGLRFKWYLMYLAAERKERVGPTKEENQDTEGSARETTEENTQH